MLDEIPLTRPDIPLLDQIQSPADLKELEIIKAELVNSGKKSDMIEKIASGKINKYISDNTLLNQVWIMDPKKKVSDILQNIKIINFVRYKVGEGV